MRQLLSFLLHLDQHIGAWFQQGGHWGYALLFLIIFCETGLVVLPFLPGDSLLFVVGLLAKQGHVQWPLCVVLLITAAILGDALNYTIGRFFGKRLVGSRWIKPAHIEKTKAFFEKHGGKTIFLGRFLPIIRTFAPFVAGMSAMPFRSFTLYNISGGTTWVCVFLGLGYFLGTYEIIRTHFSWVVICIVVLSTIPGIVHWFRTRNPTRTKDPIPPSAQTE